MGIFKRRKKPMSKDEVRQNLNSLVAMGLARWKTSDEVEFTDEGRKLMKLFESNPKLAMLRFMKKFDDGKDE